LWFSLLRALPAFPYLQYNIGSLNSELSPGGVTVVLSPTASLALVLILAPAAFGAGTDSTGDLDGDGVVGPKDLFLFQRQWHTVSPTPTPLPAEIIVDLPGLPADATPLVMVLIPAGGFVMGSTDGPDWSYYYGTEQPVHGVNIQYDFYIGKYELTQAQWLTLIARNPSEQKGANRPVEKLIWPETYEFIDALNGLGLGTFRLPTEAEWEYACRAGTETRFYFGDSDCAPAVHCDDCNLDAYAWWCGNTNDFTRPVGLLLPNAFGLYDMYGNAMEWVEDDWHATYDGAPADGSAWIDSPRSVARVVRGGGGIEARNFRSAMRLWNCVTCRTGGTGFRLMMDVP